MDVCLPAVDPPTDLKFKIINENTVQMRWSRPRSTIEGYRIQMTSDTGGCSRRVTDITETHKNNTETQKHKSTKTHKHRNKETQTHKNTETQKHRNTKTQKQRNTETQKHRNKETQRHITLQELKHPNRHTDLCRHTLPGQ